MDKKIHLEDCLKKFLHLKNQILGKTLTIGHLNPSARCSRHKIYETVDFLWLNIVLAALKYAHIREKRSYLLFLKSSKNEAYQRRFYKMIGIEGFTLSIPSIGFFSDYVKYFDPHELEDVRIKRLRQLALFRPNLTYYLSMARIFFTARDAMLNQSTWWSIMHCVARILLILKTNGSKKKCCLLWTTYSNKTR